MTMVKRYSAHCSMRLLEENIRRMTGNRGAHIQLIHNFEQFQHKVSYSLSPLLLAVGHARNIFCVLLSCNLRDCFSNFVLFLSQQNRKLVPWLVNSAGRPRFTTIHNPEEVKLVTIILYGTKLLAPSFTALVAVSLVLTHHRSNFQ